MPEQPQVQSRPWWQLGQLEGAALLLGALVGLMAAAPMVWLSAEAHRTGNPGLSLAAPLFPRELLLVWLSGAVIGGWLAAALVRSAQRWGRTGGGMWRHLLRLTLGALVIILLAPLPASLIAALTGGGRAFFSFYIVAGGLIGWQSGVIAFVFLYTFRALEDRKTP